MKGPELAPARTLKLGRAALLLDALHELASDHQGHVYFNRTVTYAWLRTRVPAPERTLRRWMALLRIERLVDVHPTIEGEGKKKHVIGMKIRVLAPARQLSLWSEPVEIPVRKTVNRCVNPVEKRGGGTAKNGRTLRPKMAAQRFNTSFKQIREETPAPAAPAQFPQRRYAETAKLIAEAERSLEEDAREGRSASLADLKERLKCVAAANGVAYDGQMIETALGIAERRARGFKWPRSRSA